MNYIVVDQSNINEEHICCAITAKNEGSILKKAWISERFADGLVFLKADVRGKCFIEYMPAENAFCPIRADGYMYIDCLWVSGKFQGQGYARALLEQCIHDSRQKGKKGLVILSSQKKKPYLADGSFLRHMGFILADRKDSYFDLMVLPFNKHEQLPCFSHHPVPMSSGFVLYYTHQCPFAAVYAGQLKEAARKRQADFQMIQLANAQEAQHSPAVFSTFSLFYQGKFITHEIMSVNKFEKIMDQYLKNEQ